MSSTVFAVPSPLALRPAMNALASTVATPPLHGSEAVDFAVLTRGALPPARQPAHGWRDTADQLHESAHCSWLWEADGKGKVRRQRHSVYAEMGIHQQKTSDKADEDKEAEAERHAPRRPRPSSAMLLSGILTKGLPSESTSRRRSWQAKLSDGGRWLRSKSASPFMGRAETEHRRDGEEALLWLHDSRS